MIHFVSTWYDPNRPWYSPEQVWFHNNALVGADDTVTQARIFHQGSEEARLVVLNYAPSLRRFLHSQGIFDVPYWSFFDAIQGLEDDYTRPLNFLTLEWPEDVSFHYNPFIVTVMREDDVYARVYLAREGTLHTVRYFGDGMPTLERIYDDRGFLSSVLMHDEEGRAMTQYYLSRAGDVILSEDVPSGRIDVVDNPDGRFQQEAYDSWETLIAEVLGGYLDGRRGHGDTVVLALAEQHNDLVAGLLSDQTLVLSRFADRPSAASPALLERAGASFADVGDGNAGTDEDGWAYLPTLSIYPLERRPTFGASANEARVYISLFVDSISTDELDYAIALLAARLVADEHTLLQVCTYRSHDLDYLRDIRRVIAGYQHLDLAVLGDDAESVQLGADLGIGEGPEEQIQLVFIDREADLIQTMARSRVLIDLGARIDRRLAVEAINAGVPQINRHEQPLTTHPINGYVLSDEAELPAAVDRFLVGLEHWNESLVQCRVLVDLFTAREVLGRWELLREGVTDAGPADRA